MSSPVPKSTTHHRRRRAAKLCVRCNTPVTAGTLCEDHRRRRNIYARERRRAELGYKGRYLNAESYSFKETV